MNRNQTCAPAVTAGAHVCIWKQILFRRVSIWNNKTGKELVTSQPFSVDLP